MPLQQTILNNPSEVSMSFFFLFDLKPHPPLCLLALIYLKFLIFLSGNSLISTNKIKTGLLWQWYFTRIKDWAFQYCQTSISMQSTQRGLIEWPNLQVKVDPYFFATEEMLHSLPPSLLFLPKKSSHKFILPFVPCLVSSIRASQAQADKSASKPPRWPISDTQLTKRAWGTLTCKCSTKVTPMMFFHVCILFSVHRTQHKAAAHSKCTIKPF